MSAPRGDGMASLLRQEHVIAVVEQVLLLHRIDLGQLVSVLEDPHLDDRVFGVCADLEQAVGDVVDLVRVVLEDAVEEFVLGEDAVQDGVVAVSAVHHLAAGGGRLAQSGGGDGAAADAEEAAGGDEENEVVHCWCEEESS